MTPAELLSTEIWTHQMETEISKCSPIIVTPSELLHRNCPLTAIKHATECAELSTMFLKNCIELCSDSRPTGLRLLEIFVVSCVGLLSPHTHYHPYTPLVIGCGWEMPCFYLLMKSWEFFWQKEFVKQFLLILCFLNFLCFVMIFLCASFSPIAIS